MKRLAAILLFAAILFAHSGPAAAQVQTYSYQGQAFDPNDPGHCPALSPNTCVPGSISGFVTFGGVSPSYSGGVSTGNMYSFGMTADGLTPTLGLSDGSVSINMTGGVITSWSVGLLRNSSDPIYQIDTSGIVGTGGNDFGLLQYASPLRAYLGGTAVIGQWTNPKSLGKSWLIAGGCCAGDPIDIGSGNLFEEAQDYATAGQNPLAFTRYYNSLAWPDTYATTLGQNWRTIFDRYLHIINPSAIYGVVAERPDGRVISFSSSSGTYTPDSDVDYSLTKSGSTWTLKDPNDTTEIYYASGGKATLQSITLRNGYTQAVNYTSGQISYVSDSYGRQLGLSYSSAGLLSGVTTPDTLTLSYGYVAFASAGTHALSTVTYNTSPATHQTYLYENASYPYALTGITDENGHRYATWAYDTSGRATSSQLATGANYTQISYSSTGNRTVTGPLGIVETYKFTALQGVPKVTEIDRAANGSVASATSYITYDSSGYLKTRTDWNGNQTAYTNNAHGLPTQIVYASGSPAHHTTTITYDGTWAHLAASIAEQGVTTGITYDSSGNMATRTLTDTTSQTIPYSTNGQTRTWTYTWTPTGQLKTVQLPRLDVTAKTTYGYTGGTLTSITDALSHTTSAVTFQSGGRPLTVTDPNSVLTTYTYSTREWPTSAVLSVSGGSLTTSITYDSAGNLTKTTLPDSSYLSYGYDNAHRVTLVTNPLSETQGITYDSAGNVTQTLWKNAGGTTKRQHTATFDALGRMLHDVGGQSQTTAYTYDSNSNWVSITDPIGHISYRSSDQLNRLTKFKDAAKNLSQIAYDSASCQRRSKNVPDGGVKVYQSG
jgi:YD repeat-containing protein